jgi:two-component sensor histidine kinase
LFSAARQTQSQEAKRVLAEASGRIAAMAAAQRVLYATTDAISFNAREFIDAVCQTAQQTFSQDLNILCDVVDSELPNDAAMPLALILNELLTNAIKHGLNGHGGDTLRVGLTKDGNSFLLYVEDDGPGFDLATVRNRSSGLQLVQGLARQLRGHFEVTRTPSTRCVVRFS